MSAILGSAIVMITLALIFYTTGVWGERIKGRLTTVHLAIFYLGLIFDTAGTTIMSRIAGGYTLSAHSVTGLLAIILMLIHALWATIVLVRKDEKQIQTFHKFSLVVWLIWLIPYILGLFLGMSSGS